jgi:hypothetical protein
MIAPPRVYSRPVSRLVLDVLVAGAVCDYPELGPVDGLYVPRAAACWQCWAAYRARLATLGVDWAYDELVRGLILALDHEPAVSACE